MKKFLLVIFVSAVIFSFFRNNKDNESFALENDLKVYYLNVGQADSILISLNNDNMLIDAGNNADAINIVNYIKSLGISKFKYVIATHPHEDHIGGMDAIIDNFEIDNFYMPDVITTTKTFEDMLISLSNNNLKYVVPNVLDEFILSDAKWNVLSITDDESNLNNTSIVIKLLYGETSFLFMGDAEEDIETNLLSMDIASDVLKVGHHGSSSSTTNLFLNKVNPKYAIISVGKNNTYKHPNDSTLKRIKNKNIDLYRTDLDGTIIVTSDGKNISVDLLEVYLNG